MFLRTLLQNWLQNTAKAHLRDAAVRAARAQATSTAPTVLADAPGPCHLGVVFALTIESGCFEDILEGLVTIRGKGFVIREGGLRGRRIAMILSGPGRENAARAAEILIDGHRPQLILSAGFAGGLSLQLKRNDILLVDRLLAGDGREIVAEPPVELLKTLERPGVHRGPLLTLDRVVRLPTEKQSLHCQSGAMAIDMETFAVAEVCRQRALPFSAVRVINDTADETLPTDVEYLLNQKTKAAQFGAAVGAVLQRPSSAKDMYQLRENALVASGCLAQFLAAVQFASSDSPS